MTRNGKSNGASRNGGKGNGGQGNGDVRWFGQKLKRKEDPRLIKGISHYTDDFKPAGMLHCAFTRSPHAHAQIKSIRVDAAQLVEVDYEPLPVVTDMEKALAKDTPYVHEEFKSNQAFTHSLKNGDVDAAFKKADRVVKQRMVNQRLAPIAMETRGVLAEYLPGENRLTVWSSTQIPHLLKTQISLLVGLPETTLRVIAPEARGGFGRKLNLYGEERTVPSLAMTVGKPVKWTETRRENFL